MLCERCGHPPLDDGGLIPGTHAIMICRKCAYPERPGIRSAALRVVGPGCESCGRELFLIKPGRTICERCRLDAKHSTPESPVAIPGCGVSTGRPNSPSESGDTGEGGSCRQ